MERRFACTACGKCCVGWIPMTIADAVKHADKFPIAMVWTPVASKKPAHNDTARLFTTCRSPKGGRIALRIVATAYIHPSLPCPLLTEDSLCGIHDDKPLRCRTMPFFPYRSESAQEGFLRPRAGWECDVSANAPVVYRGGKLVDRTDFDRELEAVRSETNMIRRYAEGILRSAPSLPDILAKVSDIDGGNVVLSFATLLQSVMGQNVTEVARRQLPILRQFAMRTANDPNIADYHRRYNEWSNEFARLASC